MATEQVRYEVETGVRNSGRTTRIADQLIQELFANGEITVQDHYNQDSAHYYLLRVIVRRLEFEHLNADFKVKGFNIKLKK